MRIIHQITNYRVFSVTNKSLVTYHFLKIAVRGFVILLVFCNVNYEVDCFMVVTQP